MSSNKDPLQVKLTDFGFSAFFDEKKKFTERLGSHNYMAPEIIKNEEYSYKVDIWATGCIIYSMFCGCMAFDGDNKKLIDKAILKTTPDMSDRIWKGVS